MMKIKEKFLAAYDKYAPSIFRHIFFRVSDKILAEDLTQETFFKAWRHIVAEEAGEIKNFKAFFYKIAGNLIIDSYRRKSRSPLAIDSVNEKDIVSRETTEEKISKKIDADSAVKRLSELSDEYRQILICRYIDGLSIKEIVDITGKSSNHISVIIHRGLKILKEKMNV